jgi:hypothetical protein
MPGPVPQLTAVRYVAPFREGGSVPALVEADDGHLYVVKLRGAAQGVRALVAEVIVGSLAEAVGLPVPPLALVTVDATLAKTEPHQEIAELLRASVGQNAALRHLPSALGFDPAARPTVPAALASRLVLFDSYVENVDRTPRNPNLLWSGGTLWLIDHGASLYWHHDWDGAAAPPEAVGRGFPLVRDHVLLPWATELPDAAGALTAALDDATIAAALDRVPDDWLAPDPAARRRAYVQRLVGRRAAIPKLLEEATRAHAQRV